MIILPIKRQNFEKGIPGQSHLLIKSFFALIASLIISFVLINNETFLFSLFK